MTASTLTRRGFEFAYAPGRPCAEADPELWFPHSDWSDDARAAKALCAGCPVRVECARWAIDNGIEHGVWGGMNVAERRRARRVVWS